MTLHGPYAVQANATLIDGIQSLGINTGTEMIRGGGDGEVTHRTIAIGNQRPGMTFSTVKLAAALAAIGLDGYKIAAASLFTAWLQAYDEGAKRKAGSTHEKFIVTEGIIVPRTLTASHNGAGSIDYEVVATYDGTNEPILPTSNQALTGTPANDALHGAGPVKINGTLIPNIQEITIDFGIELIVGGGDSGVWPTFVAIERQVPIITVRTTDVTQLQKLGLDGTAQGATDSVVFLRKFAADGTRVADITAEHIAFTIDQGIIYVSDMSASHEGGSGAEATIVIAPSDDGTNAIIAIDTAIAIS